MKLRLIKGDLSGISADAIVNAAGSSLNMGGGVAAALKRAGGQKLAEEAAKIGPVKLGGAVYTKAYKLDARYVIHAVGQPHYGDYKATGESVYDATSNALKVGEDLHCRSIAFPAIGCGIAGLSASESAESMIKAFQAFEGEYLEEASIVAFNSQVYDEFRKYVD